MLYASEKSKWLYFIDLKEFLENTAREAKQMVVSYPNNPTAAMAPDCFYQELISFAIELVETAGVLVTGGSAFGL